MSRFRYGRDALCLLACALYALNVLWLREQVGGAFLHGYFNDLLLIPAALPLVLWVQRWLGVRTTDTAPRWGEIVLHVAAWSLVAELIAPQVLARATGDWVDVAAYAAGGLVAGCWWQGAPMG